MATEVEPANTADKFSANAEELESYYLMLEAGNIPELQWQFPGEGSPRQRRWDPGGIARSWSKQRMPSNKSKCYL